MGPYLAIILLMLHYDLLAGVSLSLHSKVEIQDDRVYLGKLAQCSGDIWLCQRVQAVDVIATPPHNRKIYLRRSEIEQVLREEIATERFDLTGSRTVLVEGRYHEVESRRLHRDLEEQFRDHMHDGLRIVVDNVSWTRVPWLREIDYGFRYDLRPLLKSRVHQQTSSMPVTILDNNGTAVVKASARVTLKYFNRLPVLVRDIPAKHVIKTEDLDLQWLPLRMGLLKRMEEIVGRASKFSLAKGRPISFRDAVQPVLVRAGQEIEVLVVKKGIQIVTRGTARSSGRIGERVLVALKGSTLSRTEARVVAERRVQLL